MTAVALMPGRFAWPLLSWTAAIWRPCPAAMMTSRLPARGRRADTGEDDATLVQWAMGGDRRAFDVLYRRHVDVVWSRLTRLIGPDPEREDLTQQIFMDVFRNLSRYRGEASFRTYLGRVAVNVACDHLGGRRRRPQAISAEILETLIAPEASPEAQAEQRQRLQQTWTLLDSIKPKKRVAFILRTVEGMSLEEVSGLVGASVATVAKRVKHAEHEIVRLLSRRSRDEGSRGNSRVRGHE
jgi:RNA polymerase sigma-70 factor, ECF subfamily